MTVTHINKVEADKVYEELLEALGTEHNKGQWFEFVKAVKHWLPFVGKGRPTGDQINNSVIGQKGFTGWQVMVAAPLADGGFNTPVDTWNKWSQAAEVVFANPYLEKLKLSQPAVLKLRTKFKGMDFPGNKEDLEKAEEQHKLNDAKAKADNIKELKDRILELEQEIIAANAKLGVFESQHNDNKDQQLKLVEIEKSSAVLKSESEQQIKENAKISVQLKEFIEENNTLKAVGRFGHLVRFFTG